VRALVGTALGLTLLGACDAPTGTGTISLSWAFADGRGCAEAGASTVAIRLGDAQTPLQSFPCAFGAAPAEVTFGGVPVEGAVLSVEARSPQAALLYLGRAEFDALPASATVTLYAAAAR
jgi:hypothetical protein